MRGVPTDSASTVERPAIHRVYVEGVNAYVVKPVEFGAFSEAVKQLGLFWLVINEPPPDRESSG